MINFQTLNSLVDILKKNQIRCGIGGSYLLQIHELCNDPNDVDFWVAPEDIRKVRNIFSHYEEIIEKIQLPSQYHFKMRYLDIYVDFVACFIVKPNKNEYVYNIMPENIEMVDMQDGSTLPCTSLEDWYIVYKLLRREEKAELIKKYIYQKDASKANERLELLIDNKVNRLPKRITKDVKDLIWDNMQLKLDDYLKMDKDENDE